MEVYIEDEDLENLEYCMEVADPGDDTGPPFSDEQRTWNSGNKVVEGLRMLLPTGSKKRLRVVVE